jgi:SAM-dependent methyltransferase
LPTLSSYRAPDETAEVERKRLQQLGALFDEPTISRLRRFGAQPGWHCLEIGAGSGSVARALAALVAPDGYVLATDVDDRFLEGEEHHLEFRVHDIARDPLPTDRFDLAHARGVLEHIGERERALATMVGATKPGGYVVIEDPDWLVFDAQPLPDAFGALHRKLRDVYLAASGYDPNLGRRLPALLAAAGLVDVDAEGSVFTMRGATPSMEWYVLGLERALPALVQRGIVDADLATSGLAEARDPQLRLLSPLQMTAWGRKPR